jgi:hypothetical protein
LKPFALIGLDKVCFDHALSIAHENNFHFVSLEAKDFSQHEKDFYTASLDEALCLFYLSDADKLSVAQTLQFIEMIKDSPHRFMLSAQSFNWVFKKHCLTIVLSKTENELTTQLKILFNETDRDAVRLALKNADPIHLFHILKFGAWQQSEALEAMLAISRNLYKCHKSFILDMLAFALLPKPFATFHNKTNENPCQKSIKSKLSKMLPSYSSSEIADTFLFLKTFKTSFSSPNLQLSDEEKAFLGIVDSAEQEQTQAVFLRTANLGDYF